MPIDEMGYWVPPATVHLPEINEAHPPEYIYRSIIPEGTTQTPGELLDEYYSDRADVRDWTDPNGVLRVQQEVFREHPECTALPIGSSGLIGVWPRPHGLRAVAVPVYGQDHIPDLPEFAVQFTNRNRKWPSAGIPVGDIQRGSSDRLKGADDIVLHEFLGQNLKLIVTWPGYPPITNWIHTRRCTDGEPLTRFDLARQITLIYAHFFSKVEELNVLPKKAGFYNIALHQGANAKEDSLGVQFLQLHLVEFRNTINGYWVAEVEIV